MWRFCWITSVCFEVIKLSMKLSTTHLIFPCFFGTMFLFSMVFKVPVIRKLLATYFANAFFWSFTFNKMIFSIEFFKTFLTSKFDSSIMWCLVTTKTFLLLKWFSTFSLRPFFITFIHILTTYYLKKWLYFTAICLRISSNCSGHYLYSKCVNLILNVSV